MPEDQTDSGDTMKTIAIIDDDIHIGDMLEEILTKEGFSVPTQAQKRCISCQIKKWIWCCWI